MMFCCSRWKIMHEPKNTKHRDPMMLFGNRSRFWIFSVYLLSGRGKKALFPIVFQHAISWISSGCFIVCQCRNPKQREYPSPISHYLQFAKHFQATLETALCRESTSSGISNTDGTFNFNVHSFCCFPSAVSSVAILSNNACMNSKVKNRDRNVNIVSTNSSAANAPAIQFIPYFVNCKRSVLFLVHSSALFCVSRLPLPWQFFMVTTLTTLGI